MDTMVDYAFKRVFGSVQNKKILISMLNAFLAEYIGEITDLEFLHPEQLGIMPKDKKVSYDIYSREGTGRHFLIEMQRGRQTFYRRRAIAYVSRAISNELKKKAITLIVFRTLYRSISWTFIPRKLWEKAVLFKEPHLKMMKMRLFLKKQCFFSWI